MSALEGRQFSGVILDLDGTLISSIAAVIRSWSTLAAEYGSSFEQLGDMHGVPARTLVERLGVDADPAELLARINELEISDTEGIQALPGAEYALRHLPRDRIAIATSCTRDLAEARLKAACLPAPALMVTAEDVRFGKPSPDPFWLAARRLGMDPENCLAIEDSASGLLAARRANCATLGLTTTAPAAELEADGLAKDLSKVFWELSDAGIGIRLS